MNNLLGSMLVSRTLKPVTCSWSSAPQEDAPEIKGSARDPHELGGEQHASIPAAHGQGAFPESAQASEAGVAEG